MIKRLTICFYVLIGWNTFNLSYYVICKSRELIGCKSGAKRELNCYGWDMERANEEKDESDPGGVNYAHPGVIYAGSNAEMGVHGSVQHKVLDFLEDRGAYITPHPA
jgi:hypothetical protein